MGWEYPYHEARVTEFLVCANSGVVSKDTTILVKVLVRMDDLIKMVC